MQDLIVTIIQTELFWEDIKANLAMFDDKIESIQKNTDLIILPEMFTTGFTMNASNIAQDMEGSAVKWIKNKTKQKKADIVGSIVIKEDNRYFNRLLWAKPDGQLFTYDKRHLFRMAGEDKVYCNGNNVITVELSGWNIRPFICYDLRFPVWTRNFNNQYDLALFIANWPEKRSLHWKTLIQARAIENQCYVIGVNRVGKSGNNIPHSGDSSIVSPSGQILFQKNHGECIFTDRLSAISLQEYRKEFPAWMDADSKMISKPSDKTTKGEKNGPDSTTGEKANHPGL